MDEPIVSMNPSQVLPDTPSKAVRVASERKAKKLHFYQNGKPYDPRLTVSIIPGKDFQTLDQLNEYLTQKTQLLNGVKYIFTLQGDRIQSLEQLEHGQTYVLSGTKTLLPSPYGMVFRHGAPPRMSCITKKCKPAREDDLRLLRPLSSKYNNVYANMNGNGSDDSPTGIPRSRDIRTITVVNNKDHRIYSKVIVNLKTPKSFDLLLADLADAVQIRYPKVMFTASGQMVKSVSHLKHELTHIDLFYIDNEHPYDCSLSNPELSGSPPSPWYQSPMILAGGGIGGIDPFSMAFNPLYHTPAQSDSAISLTNGNGHRMIKEVTQETPPRIRKQKSSKPPPPPSSNHSDSRSPSFIDSRKDFEPETRFGLDQVSAYKYEQIKLYVERLIEETSLQIQNEGLLPRQENQRINEKKLQNSTTKNGTIPKIKPKPTTTNRAVREKGHVAKPQAYSMTPRLCRRGSDHQQKVNYLGTTRTNNLAIPGGRSHLKVSMPNLSDAGVELPKKISTPLARSNPNIAKTSTILNNKNRQPGIKRTTTNLPPTGKLKNSTKNNPEIKNEIQQSKPNNKQVPVNDVEKFLHGTVSPPEYYLTNKKIFGYNGKRSKNLVYLNTGELVFYTGIYAILWNHNTGKQRFYAEHDNDICCLRVDKSCEYIATTHLTPTAMMIRIWSVKNLRTVKVLTNKIDLIDLEFTINNSLFILTGGKESSVSLWNWRLKINTASTSEYLEDNEQVFGMAVHPTETDIMVTYGKMHLVVWHFKKDRNIECRTALQMQSKIIKTIHCAEFLNDNSLLTGDSNGNLTIWAPFEMNHQLEFAIKEVKGHESQLTCFRLTKENILISGDRDGAIKTWDVNENEFRLLNAVKLPSLSGSVSSITLPNKSNEILTIFVGTTNNFILKGSALQTEDYQIIFEGHYMAIRTVSVDLNNNIYSASLDRKICKWNEHGLIWRTDANVQGMSSSVHPNGQVLSVGSANGIIIIINAITGEAMQYIQLTNVCIGCMSYSPDGNFLVAGCQDGTLHVIPVREHGRVYDKVSTLKGPLPILTLQWSMDTQFILTSVDDNNYQELILWDLPNTRYIRNVTSFSDNLQWYNVTCSGLEDARGTWDNENFQNVINICINYSPSLKCIVTGDEKGYIRLFSYPCFDSKASYFQYKQGGGSVTDVKFSSNEQFIVGTNFDGTIFIWKLNPYPPVSQTSNIIKQK